MKSQGHINEQLDRFRIEIPSWGFADTGTRFGKYFQPASAITIEDKLADAGQVNRLTGCCPTVAMHVLWDLKEGVDPCAVVKYARKQGVRIGSIDPYQIFRIFHEIHSYEYNTGHDSEIAYMIDQSHNIKPKIDAMIQMVMTAQELWLKSSLVNRKSLKKLQTKAAVVDSGNCLKEAYSTDVRPAIIRWRKLRGLPADPLKAHRASGYENAVAQESTARRKALGG